MRSPPSARFQDRYRGECRVASRQRDEQQGEVRVSGNVSAVSNRATIEGVVLQILKDLTADWDTDYGGEIGPDTQLIADLDFESIDVVELVVSLEGRFERRDLPFEKL